MSGEFSSKRSMHAMARLSADRLLLRISDFDAAVCYGLILAGLLLAIANMLLGLILILPGIIGRLGPHTTLFDRNSGLITIRRFLFLHKYPLSQIAAVRVIFHKFVAKKKGYGGSYSSYRLILDFENDFVCRMVLAENGDLSRLCTYGREISQFLGVPFFDQRNPIAESHPTTEVSLPAAGDTRPATAVDEKKQQWALKRAIRKEKSNENKKSQRHPKPTRK